MGMVRGATNQGMRVHSGNVQNISHWLGSLTGNPGLPLLVLLPYSFGLRPVN